MKYCYNCMKPSEQSICPYCGHPADKGNAPGNLPAGAVLSGRYLVGIARKQTAASVTYLGLDQTQNKRVLILEARGDTGAFLRFARSLTASRNLSVVSGAREVLEANGKVFVVMEELQGPSLTHYIQMRGGKLTLEETLRLMRFMLDALAECHRAGLAHGGIGAQAVVLDPMGGARLQGFLERTDAVPEQDVYDIARLLCGCVAPGTSDPNALPGLTERQRMALKVALAPQVKERFANAAALTRALTEEPQAQPAKAPQEMPKTVPGRPAPINGAAQEVPRTAPARTAPVNPPQDVPRTAPANAPQDMPRTAPANGPQDIPRTAPANAPQDMPRTAPANGPQGMPRTAPANVPQGMPRTVPANDTVTLGGQNPNPGGGNTSPVTGGSVVSASEEQWKKDASGTPKKKKRILLLAAAAALVALLVVCFFTVHIWVDANCEKPERCVLCGKTEGEALGHSWAKATCEAPKTCEECGRTQGEALGHAWQAATCISPKSCSRCHVTSGTAGGHGWEEATCTSPKTCTYCGEQEGSALGHDWQPATYTAPKTCSRCSLTEGNVRGYYPTVSGYSERFYTRNFNSWCLRFDDPVEKCKQFTLNVEVTNINYGTVEGRWEAFYLNKDDAWVSLGYFEMVGTTASVTYYFNPTEEVKAVAAVIADRRSASYSKYVSVTDLYALD